MKLFISQPMHDKTENEIIEERNLAIEMAKTELNCDNIEILDTYLKEFDGNGLQLLAKSLDVLAIADIAVFTKGWFSTCDCIIEYLCAITYKIKTICM